jgi:hypothetical protein
VQGRLGTSVRRRAGRRGMVRGPVPGNVGHRPSPSVQRSIERHGRAAISAARRPAVRRHGKLDPPVASPADFTERFVSRRVVPVVPRPVGPCGPTAAGKRPSGLFSMGSQMAAAIAVELSMMIRLSIGLESGLRLTFRAVVRSPISEGGWSGWDAGIGRQRRLRG